MLNALKMLSKCNEGIELRKEIALPISKCNYKNQITFMNLISKKPFNDETTLKQTEVGFIDNDGQMRMTNSMKNSAKNELQLQDFEDEVWKLAVDVSWNYEMYYPLENSLNLS